MTTWTEQSDNSSAWIDSEAWALYVLSGYYVSDYVGEDITEWNNESDQGTAWQSL